jgi:phosphoribosyl 1,2-cyclic phosphodiesterase
MVVCDLLMPRYNGYQVCRTLRAQASMLGDLKIIVTAASTYTSDRMNALEAGASAYLVKPVKFAELTRILDELTSGTTMLRSPTAATHAPMVPTMNANAQLIGRPPKMKFWGVRGSIATPGPSTVGYGGNTSCVEVRADGEIIILDAGTGIRQLGRSMMSEFKGQSINLTLLVSHTHWDHIQGFPFFIPAYNPNNKIRIIGYEGASSGLKGTLSSQMESPYFPVSMQEMPSHLQVEELKDFQFQIGSVTVKAAFLNHPGICVGYRIYTSGGSIAYLPDNEPYSRLHTVSGDQSTKSYEALSYAQKQDEKLIEFIQGADILIMDSQYDDSEYRSHIGWGHGCVDDVVAIAVIAKVKKLFLFHHDPDHDDEQVAKMEQWAKELVMIHGEELEVAAAREGVEVVLDRVVRPDYLGLP